MMVNFFFKKNEFFWAHLDEFRLVYHFFTRTAMGNQNNIIKTI
jgi:hypothetical protein